MRLRFDNTHCDTSLAQTQAASDSDEQRCAAASATTHQGFAIAGNQVNGGPPACPEAQFEHGARHPTAAHRSTPPQPNSQTFKRLTPVEEQQLGIAIFKGKARVIGALGTLPICSCILLEGLKPSSTCESAIDAIDSRDALDCVNPQPTAGTANTETIHPSQHGTPAPKPEHRKERGIDCLQRHYKAVRRHAIHSTAGHRERRCLADAFCELELEPATLFHLINRIRRIAHSVTVQGRHLGQSQTLRINAALRTIDATVAKNARPTLGWQTPFNRTADRLDAVATIDWLEQETGLPAAQFLDALEELAAAVQQYTDATHTFVQANVGLVMHIARQFSNASVDFSDIVQDGNVGLVKAVDRFDHRFGCRFSTYAAFWIRLSITRAMNRQQRVVPLPHAQMSTLFRIARTNQILAQKTGQEPPVSAIAEHLHTKKAVLHDALTAGQGIVSFDQNEQDETERPSLYNTVEQSTFPAPLDVIAYQTLQGALRHAIETLDAREAHIIGAHFGITQTHEKSLHQLGQELRLSRERVRQIKVQALERLRKRFFDVLHPFLEQS